MRGISLVLAIALTGCNSEGGFGAELPPEEPGNPPPVQGPETQTDTFITVVKIPRVDMLWVIDGSCSMRDDLQTLADHWSTFMSVIDRSKVDYRVAVTGTQFDSNNRAAGVLERVGQAKWIDRTTANPVGTFGTMTGSAGNGGASGYNFDSAKACLDIEIGDCFTSGFRRDDAPIHTVLVTDERDTSQIGEARFIEWYSQFGEEPRDRILSGILDLTFTQAYVNAINAVGGVVGDVSRADWDELLADFAQQTADSADKEEYFLSQFPVADTISVELRDITLDDDIKTPPIEEDLWVYNAARNSVLVDDVPEGDIKTVIRYEVRTTVIDAEED